ncbi:MAG: DMT family transporter [Cyanosarcina radialis HA8281-LM2]|jgi:drug/metabolite transporter (DMT)-like permease|nr:DMT family transporter [Cyanosarcina radialis HA8281-LM2]
MPLHHTSGRWRLGLALSLITVFMWGVLPIALAVTLQVLDAYTIVWFRFLVSFCLLAIYLAIRGQLPSWQKLRSLPFWLLAIAIIGLALNYLFFLKGLQQTSPSNAEVLIQLAAVLMGLGGVLIFKERYTIRQWTGLGVLTLGFVLFFNEQLKVLITAQTEYLIGSGIVILGAITWAFYGLAQKQLLNQLSSANIMLLIYGSCALLFTPVASPEKILKLLEPQNFSWLHLGMLVFCALNTLIAYGAFAESLEHWEASRVTAIAALAPLITLVAVEVVSAIAPGLIKLEHITNLGVLGAILVVGGSIAIALGKQSSSRRI